MYLIIRTYFSMTSTPQLTGKVKWFNNKAGFGFITVCRDSQQSDKDIFVHYSSIQVKNQQYKYLVPGEYVDFDLVKPANGDHEYHAVNVGGIQGGALMCETRKQLYEERTTRSPKTATREATREEVREDIQQKKPRGRKPAPAKNVAVAVAESDEGFKTVARKQSAKPKGNVRKEKSPAVEAGAR